MKKALVLTLDMGTSSVRAMLFDVRGRALPNAEVQIPYAQTTTADGGVQTDAEALLGLTTDCLKQLLRRMDDAQRGRLAGVGISCFWHSLVGVGEDGKAVTPLFSWADSRALGQAEKLKSEMDAAAYHKRTGCVLHPCYWPAKLRWLQETQPELFGKARLWMSFGEYAQMRLFGSASCSLSMASGTGLLNQNTKEWDPQTLTELPIALRQLNPLADQSKPVSGLTPEWASALRPLQALPWLPASGDGACSNVGSGAVDAARIAINVGTSGAMRVAVKADTLDIPDTLFCYRVDAERFLVGGAFANGGNVYAWAQKTLQIGGPESRRQSGGRPPPRRSRLNRPAVLGRRAVTGLARRGQSRPLGNEPAHHPGGDAAGLFGSRRLPVRRCLRHRHSAVPDCHPDRRVRRRDCRRPDLGADDGRRHGCPRHR